VLDEPSQIIRLTDAPLRGARRGIVAIGVFDGVHRGHQALLGEARRIADAHPGSEVIALTFDPHPAAVFAPAAAPPLLGTLAERAELLRAAGVDIVVAVAFDRAFASSSPEEFARDTLAERLRAAAVIVGDDFRYGRDRMGDITTLREAGGRYGFDVFVVPPVFIDGLPARSSEIRARLSAGEVEIAARLLGRPYTLGGTVVSGRRLGRTLGFPTANLESAPGVLVPAAAVYAGRARIGGETFRAAVSVGDNPTVAPEGETLSRTVEAFLLDGFDRDVYGQKIDLTFEHYLRPMEKFDGMAALIVQMNHDVDDAKRRLT
jgi:riboflavin kinase/FMN adenylyltransferase